MNTIRLLLSYLLLCLFQPFGHEATAETIHLKDGTQLDAKIINKQRFYIEIQEGKGTKRIYVDEIDHIDEWKEPENITINFAQFDAISRKKVQLIITFMQITGTYNALLSNVEKLIKESPADKERELRGIFDINALVESLIPIYDKHFTEEELVELVKFYETPAGRKLITATPLIMREAVNATIQYINNNYQAIKNAQ